jgi:hypothetical protein
MTTACPASVGGGAGRDSERAAAARGVAHWLSLAATPTFAIMALMTAVLGGASGVLCTAQDASSLTGMVPMYLLMSVFHVTPWLKLMSAGRQNND